MAPTKLYDCLIIGGGAAGLSVALGLGRVHRTCVVFSNDKFRNAGIHEIHNVLTRDRVHPDEFRRIAKEQIQWYNNTDFVDTTIAEAVKGTFDDKVAFQLSDEEGKTWVGRKLVLATGCRDKFPDIEGFRENWPGNIFQCLFCDGHERSHLPRGMLTLPSPMLAKVASMMKYQSVENATVTIFTNGPPSQDPTMQKQLENCKILDMKIEERRITRLKPAAGDEIGLHVVLEDGEEVYQGFVFYRPVGSPTSQNIIDSLGLDMVDGPFGKVIKAAEPFRTTNVTGVFAAGDAGTPFGSVAGAMAHGSAAAAGIAHALLDEDDELLIKKYKQHQQEVEGEPPGTNVADATGCFVAAKA